MKLHLDTDAFAQIIDIVSTENTIRRDVLEKDYYVTLILEELSKKQNQGFAYFKGGTALYKALRSIRRFSEDIDLTVYVKDCPTQNQAKKRLENATKKYKSLDKGKTLEDERGSITCEYLYDSMYELDIEDRLQRFGNVRVEGTSFTVSEPTEKIQIAPHLYGLCSEEYKKILRESYEVSPFIIETISLERIFIDKVFATEFYFERGDLDDVAKHVYDLTVLLQNSQITKFLSDCEEVKRIIGLKREEELKRKGGVDSNLKVKDFSCFLKLSETSKLEDCFDKMQKIYVLDDKDKICLDEIYSTTNRLHEYFTSLSV